MALRGSLISVACKRSKAHEETAANPDLSISDAEALSETEVENFARLYLIANEWLFRKSIIKPKVVNGSEDISFESGDIEHPKDEDESYVQYLYRLTVLIFDQLTKTMNDTMKAFSVPIQSQISEVARMGAELSRTAREASGWELPKEFLKTRDFVPQIRNPLDKVEARLGRLTEISAGGIELLVQTNKTQIAIAAELKASSKTNILLSWIIIWLSILSLILAGFAYSAGSKSTEALLKALDQHAQSVEAVLRDSSEAQKANRRDLIDKTIEQQGLILKELQNIRSTVEENNEKKHRTSRPSKNASRKTRHH